MDTSKLKTALKYWYEGKGYYDVIRAMSLAERIHHGTRKDGVTPEIHHQISIAGYLKTLHEGLQYPEETYIAAWLHDAPEDYPTLFGSLKADEYQWLYGPILDDIELLNKSHKYVENYYFSLSKSPVSSVVKGADRIHNHQTMGGVFSAEKQKEYIWETENLIIPMLKAARMSFPEQSSVYYNIIHILRSQVELIQVK